MNDFKWWQVLFFLLGALAFWLFNWFGRKKGKKYDEVFDRVVEESSDESTKLRTLTDGHDNALLKLRGEHEASLAKLKADHDASLVLLRKEHENTLNVSKAEATKLQGLVSTGDTHKADADALRLQLQKLKDDHGRLELDWKKKVEVAEAASVANTAKIRDLEASHARTIGEWDLKVKAAEKKNVEIQGLVGSAKADNEKVTAEWNSRVAKLESELAASRDAAAKADGEWKVRYAARETELANASSAKLRELEAAHTRSLGEWEVKVKAAESKQAEIQGLVGSAKADNDKVNADWQLRYSKLEAEVAASREASSKADLDWKARYAKLEAEAAAARDGSAKVDADWKARFAAREAELTNANAAKVRELEAAHTRSLGEWEVKVKAAESKQAEIQGLVGSAKADTDKVNADWQLRYSKLEADFASARDGSAKLDADWKARFAARETELTNANASAKAEADRVAADWQSRYSKLESDVAGLRDAAAKSEAARADWEGRHNKVNADWTARFATIESELSASRNRAAGLDQTISEWEARYRTLETDHANCGSRILGLSSQLAEATAGPDDLLIIEGIGPKINQALIGSGITKWKQVRDADEATLRAAIEKAGITFAPSITSWSGQAKYLCDGDMVGFTAYTEFLTSGQDSSNGGQSVEEYITQARPRIAAALAAGKDDLHTKDGKDNLQIVEGIGPKFNQALIDSGIDTFVKLSEANEDSLRAALTKAGLSFAPSLPTWAKQAELLVKGDRKAFDEYVSFLVAGRDSSK
jgi:predicted flap endonuclease-1-like 5' DNA nuclease